MTATPNIPEKSLEADRETLAKASARVLEIKAEIDRLTKVRNALPRSDREGANDKLKEILKAHSDLRKARYAERQARHEFERREAHSIWEAAVLALWGSAGLTACREEMRAERRRRDAK